MSKMLQISCFLIIFFTCTPFSLLNATDETTATDFLTLRRGNSQGDAREEDNSENAIKIQDTVKTPLVHDDEVQDWTGSFQSHEQMTQFFQSERDTTVSLMEVTSGAHSETSTETTTSTTLSTSSTRPTLPTLSTASEVDSLTENTTIPDILTHSLSSEEIPIIPSDKASPEATLRTFSTNVAETTFSQSTELSSTASTTSIFSTKPSTLETTQIPPIKSQMDGISSHPSTRSRMINATFSTQLKSTKLSNYSSTKEKEQPILRSTEKQSTVFISLFPSAATTPVKENLEIKENVVTKAETTTQYSDKQKDNTKKKRKDAIQERKSEAFMSRKATATDSTNNKKNKINEIQTKQGSPGPQGPPGPVGPPGPAGKKGDPGPPGECKCDNAAGSSIRMQAAVSAVLTQHFGPSKDVIIPFDLELMDLADNYDNNTGIFFCSIPGIYVISLYLMSHPGSKVNARIFVNSRPVAALWADDNKDAGFYPSASIQMINRLEFGDQVYVMLVDGGYGESWVHANYNVFTLYLLYEDMFSV